MTYSEKIINAETGEEILRPFTKEEIAEIEVAKSEALIESEKLKAESINKEAARNAVLEKLGLTADEVSALFAE